MTSTPFTNTWYEFSAPQKQDLAALQALGELGFEASGTVSVQGRSDGSWRFDFLARRKSGRSRRLSQIVLIIDPSGEVVKPSDGAHD